MRRLLMLTTLVTMLLVMWLMPSPAVAATPCNGFVSGQTINGPVTVASGTECTLDAVTVRGPVTVAPGGALTIQNSSTIQGRVAATDHLVLRIFDSIVQGSVTATGGVEAFTHVTSSYIGGHLTLTGNMQHAVSVIASEVEGSATITNNHGTLSFQMVDSTIGGSLQCSGNTGGFMEVFGNTVRGQTIGDCT